MAFAHKHFFLIGFRLLVGLAPLLLKFLLGRAISTNPDIGSGNKDILLVIPLLFWSTVFFAFYLMFWRRQFTFVRSIFYSIGFATSLCLLIAVSLALLALIFRL